MSNPTPPPVTPEQILDYAPRHPRVLRVDANVAAYFGDLFHNMRTGLSACPRKSDHKAPSGTGAAPGRS
jgi:hypothetical protein